MLVFYIRFLLSYDPSKVLTFEKIIDNSNYILDGKNINNNFRKNEYIIKYIVICRKLVNIFINNF